MPISREQLKQAIGKARVHVQNDALDESYARGMQNSGAGNMRQGGFNMNNGVSYQNVDTELSYTGADELDEYYGGGNTLDGGDIAYNEITAQNSRMPAGIKESMLREQIDTSKLGVERSVIDDLGIEPQQQKRPQQQRRVVNEVRQSTPQQYVGVDYERIRQIVKECVKEANESSSLKTIQLSGGKIKLVDNSGNIFVAELEYKGNINDKKKK